MEKDNLILMPKEIIHLFPNDWWVVLYLMSTEDGTGAIGDIAHFSCESKYITIKSVYALRDNGIIDVNNDTCYLNKKNIEVAKDVYTEALDKSDDATLIMKIRDSLRNGEHIFNITFNKDKEGLWNI